MALLPAISTPLCIVQRRGLEPRSPTHKPHAASCCLALLLAFPLQNIKAVQHRSHGSKVFCMLLFNSNLHQNGKSSALSPP